VTRSGVDWSAKDNKRKRIAVNVKYFDLNSKKPRNPCSVFSLLHDIS
jgi:hypothetical protein